MYYPTFNLFDDFFTGSSSNSIMKTDIIEKDGNYELNTELPGAKKEDIRIEFKDGTLKIGVVQNCDKEEKDKKGKVIRRERYSGSYSRSFYIGKVDDKDIKASYENGELRIVIPKDAPKKVEETNYIRID